MKPEDHYHRFVRWSHEDQCYIGFCPELFYGGCCHGEQEEQTYADLCAIIRDEIAYRLAQGMALPAWQIPHHHPALLASVLTISMFCRRPALPTSRQS